MRAFVPALALLLAAPEALAQRLDAVSRTVHTGRSRPPPSNSNNPGPSPRFTSSPGSSRARWNFSRRYLAYPYAYGYLGYDLPATVSTGETRSTASVLTVEGGLALPNIGRMGLSIRAIFGAVEVELRGSALVEPLATSTSWAGLIGVRAAVNFTEGGPVRARAFLGFASFIDARGDAGGMEGGLAFDAFPVRPLVLSAELSGGVLGRSGILSVRPSVGVLFGRTEVFAAWSHLWFFPLEEGPPVDLGGPLIGLRFWL